LGDAESAECTRRQLAQAKEQLQQALAREAELRRVVDAARHDLRHATAMCEAQDCDAYRDRGMRCPECPLEAFDVLPAALAQLRRSDTSDDDPHAPPTPAEMVRDLAGAIREIDRYLAEGDIDRIRDVLWRADAYMMAYGGEQLGGHAPRQSDFEGSTSRAHPGMTSASGDGGAAHPAAQERPERAFGKGEREC